MVSYAKKALHGAATVFVLTLMAALSAYFLRFLLARKLSIEDYGLFFALFSFINLLVLFKDLGQGYALLKFIPELIVKKDWNRIKSLISSSFLIQLFSSAIIAFLLITFAPQIMPTFFHTSDTKLLILFAIIFFVSFAQNVVSIGLQSFQRMFLYSLQDLSRNLVVLAISFVLLWLGFGILAPVWAYLIMYVVVFLFFFFLFTKKVFKQFWKAHALLAGQDFSRLILFGLPAMLTIFGNNVLQYTDTLMLSYFKDLASVGLYQVAAPLAGLVLYVAYSVSAVATPLISELLALKKRIQLRKGIEFLHKYVFIAIIPMAVVLIAFPEIFIRLFFGDKFINSAPALQILAGGMVLYSIAYTNLNALFGLGRPKYTTTIMLISAVANVILNLALVPRFGIIGAACGTSLSYLLMLALSSRGIRRILRIREPWVVWAKTLLAAIILAGIISGVKALLSLNPWIELAIGAFAGGIAYCLLLLALKIVSREEIAWIASHFGLRRAK